MSMGLDDKIQLFEDKRIRTAWDEEKEEWYFSVVDVVAVLTEAPNHQAARNYWKVTKKLNEPRFSNIFIEKPGFSVVKSLDISRLSFLYRFLI